MFKRFFYIVLMALVSVQTIRLMPVSEVSADTAMVNQNAFSQNTSSHNAFSNNILNQWFAAAKKNDIVLLRQLISKEITNKNKQKLSLESRDEKGRTALLIATHHNAIEAAKLLIEAGADVNAKDNKQDSPYLYAGAEGKLEILKLTVAAGADLKSTNRYGGTALTPAAHHGHLDVVKYLVTTDIDIDQVNNLGWTALLEAIILGNGNPTYQQIVKALLDAGADKTISDDNNDTPLDHANMKQQFEIINILEAH